MSLKGAIVESEVAAAMAAQERNTDRRLAKDLRLSAGALRIYRTRGLPPETAVWRRSRLLHGASLGLGLPLGSSACELLAWLRYLIDNEMFFELGSHQYVVELILREIPLIAKKGIGFSNDDWERVLVTSYWLLGIELSTLSGHSKENFPIRKYWDPVSQLLLRMLQTRSDEDWAALLHFRFEFNIRIAIPWNTSSSRQRSSETFRAEMISQIEDMDFFGKAELINDRFPSFLPAPYNALTFASHLGMPGKHQNMDDQYHDLGSRVARADKRYADVDWIIKTHELNARLAVESTKYPTQHGRPRKSPDPLLDSDMDGFVGWVRETRPAFNRADADDCRDVNQT